MSKNTLYSRKSFRYNFPMARPSLQPQPAPGGFLVCIEENPNGSYVVSGQEGGGPSLNPAQRFQVGSVQEAFEAAFMLFQQRAENRGRFTPNR